MTSENRPDIEALLRQTDMWIPMADGTYESRYETAGNGYRHVFSKEELCTHHPLFPRVIEGLATKRHWLTDEFGASGSHVECTLRVLFNNSYVFPCYHSGANVFSQVTEIKLYPNAERWITLKGVALTLVSLDMEGPAVPLVARAATEEKMFNMDYIDTMYPGWEARWHTAVTLGLEPGALAEYCFRQASALHNVIDVFNLDEISP